MQNSFVLITFLFVFVSIVTSFAELPKLMSLSQGNSEICVAVLDGPVDCAHPCFQGANLTALPTLVPDAALSDGSMSNHGTHVASIIFGQPNSNVPGIAPQCRGLLVPVFPDDRCSATQLDLARGIEQAANAGAHIINLSGGQLTDFGEAEGWLENAVHLCQEKNIILVAAAGNDGCPCLHVPAALPAALAVGAMDARGQPLDFSNWGSTYQTQGILAPGEQILGAQPGGGTQQLNGTSFATPIVSGVAALLLSLQVEQGQTPDPARVRQILLQSALPCNVDLPADAQRCLAGKLNIAGAITLLKGENMSQEEQAVTAAGLEPSGGCGCGPGESAPDSTSAQEELQPPANSPSPQTAVTPSHTQSFTPISNPQTPMTPSHAVTPSQAPNELASSQLVYALGTLGYDFGSEARRDTFKQLMPPFELSEGVMVPANPYDARQMVDYLASDISEARSLIWTLNIELTPVYAIEPKGPFAREAYLALQELLAGQIQPESDDDYIERVSIPGILSGRTIKLFSGQVVPVIEPQSTRGLYGWKVNSLVNAAFEEVQTAEGEADQEAMRRTLGSFLNRVYYDLRNLGTTSQDRALNFSVTNAFQAASTFSQAVAQGMELDSITVEKSPFCRMDSDCWDVKLKFFDPENSRRAKKIFRFTIDVSDLIPVTLGEVKSWSSPY